LSLLHCGDEHPRRFGEESRRLEDDFGPDRNAERLSASSNNTNSGWLVGAGIEWAFAPNWSAKVEYNYLGLDDRTFIVPAGVPGFLPGDTFTQSNRNIQTVKVGINYLFNWSGYRY
jgi:opacity protein-like surface antigen